jgi:hypothetical protein
VNVSFFTGILEDSILEYTKSDHENYKTIVLFDCRGVELTDFDFRVRNVELGVQYQEKWKHILHTRVQRLLCAKRIAEKGSSTCINFPKISSYLEDLSQQLSSPTKESGPVFTSKPVLISMSYLWGTKSPSSASWWWLLEAAGWSRWLCGWWCPKLRCGLHITERAMWWTVPLGYKATTHPTVS